MTQLPSIPYSPKDLPPQHINAVVDLPTKPDNLLTFVETLPDEARPRARSPRSSDYLGAIEWAWSPREERLSGYYVEARRAWWLLWACHHDDNLDDWNWQLVAVTRRKSIDHRTAAIHLLIDRLKHEAEHEKLDQFHWLAEEGTLSVAEWRAIARVVWSETQHRRGKARGSAAAVDKASGEAGSETYVVTWSTNGGMQSTHPLAKAHAEELVADLLRLDYEDAEVHRHPASEEGAHHDQRT